MLLSPRRNGLTSLFKEVGFSRFFRNLSSVHNRMPMRGRRAETFLPLQNTWPLCPLPSAQWDTPFWREEEGSTGRGTQFICKSPCCFCKSYSKRPGKTDECVLKPGIILRGGIFRLCVGCSPWLQETGKRVFQPKQLSLWAFLPWGCVFPRKNPTSELCAELSPDKSDYLYGQQEYCNASSRSRCWFWFSAEAPTFPKEPWMFCTEAVSSQEECLLATTTFSKTTALAGPMIGTENDHELFVRKPFEHPDRSGISLDFSGTSRPASFLGFKGVDDREITHLICVRLKHLLFSGGVLGLLPVLFLI